MCRAIFVPGTLRAVIAHVKLQLREPERQTADFALCHSADLRRIVGELRGLLGRVRSGLDWQFR